jgi:pimeloyl-ACP methyl ester carboxylesterase
MRTGKHLVTTVFLVATACAAGRINFQALYSRAARAEDLDRNPVILVPGMLGSTLRDAEGHTVWGIIGRRGVDPETEQGARMFALPIPEKGSPFELHSEVRATDVLDTLEVRFLGVPIEIRAYANILRSLGIYAGYRDESLGRSGAVDYGSDHYTCFQFPYDFRLDIAANAKQFDHFIREKAAYVRAEDRKRFGRERDRLKFDIVAHSFGGLIVRYYLRYGANDIPLDGPLPAPNWEGARMVEHVVLVGTPNAGSLQSLDALVHGRKFGLRSFRYSPALLGTFPSLYESLPRSRHRPVVDAATGQPVQDLFDPALWSTLRWGLADPSKDGVLKALLPDEPSSESRRRIALTWQRKLLERARRVQDALDTPADPPANVSLHLIAGDAIATMSVAAVDRRTGKLTVVGTAPGDGTVTRSSALMDEREAGAWSRGVRSPIHWKQITFLPSDHLGMTSDPTFTDNILFMLLEARN